MLVIKAIPTPGEQIRRFTKFTVGVFSKVDGSINSLKSWKFEHIFTPENDSLTVEKFINLKEELVNKLKLNQLLCIQVLIKPLVYFEPEPANGLSQSNKKGYKYRAKQEKYMGLINEGTTCYMNSLLQTYFMIKAFRRAVFDMPTDINDYKSIPFCLQRIFYNL